MASRDVGVSTTTRGGPPLVDGRRELSGAVGAALRRGVAPRVGPETAVRADPGKDLQLALYLLYVLRYRGFWGCERDRERDPELLGLRGAMEDRFLEGLRAEPADAPRTGEEAFTPLLVEPMDLSRSLSHPMERNGELWQLRKYAALRSLYHLKEADTHAWVIPRLTGRAKTAMVAMEYDEFDAGRAEDMHARLFADLMADLGLETGSATPLPRCWPRST